MIDVQMIDTRWLALVDTETGEKRALPRNLWTDDLDKDWAMGFTADELTAFTKWAAGQ